MTQEAIELRTTGDSYPGVSVIQDTNKALATVATDFAGADDPASLAGPYMTWADTGTLTIKRRNAANSEWVIEGRLFRAHLPIIPLADIPTTDIGQISVVTKGTMEWDGTAYAPLIQTPEAIDVSYDSAESGLEAQDVQAAIDELSTANNIGTKAALNAAGTAPIYACRAWVNFLGLGTVAIRASGNVSSVVDVGVGNYTINFTVPFQDMNYAATPSLDVTSGYVPVASIASTSMVHIACRNGGGVNTDSSYVGLTIHR